MILKTTEKKIRDNNWDHHIYEPGCFFKEIDGVKIELVEKDYEEHQDEKESDYEVFYFADPNSPDGLVSIGQELKKLEMNNKGTTKIELKRHDILKIQDRKYKWTHFSLVEAVNDSDSRFCRYILNGCPGFNDDFMDFDHSMEIMGVWRYDDTTDSFVKIYEKEESKTGE